MTDPMIVRSSESGPHVANPIYPSIGGPIYARAFKGLYRNLRMCFAGFLMLIFFATSWFNFNGHQAVLWDIAERKFYVFGATFWPQDFALLSAILIIAAFGLFFLTVLFGRIWCGYSCPQSMWMWLFMWAEKVTEGDRSQRMKLAKAPFGLKKLAKRSAKHALWLLMSVATAIAFVGYFTPVRELVADLLTLEVGLGAGFWVAAFTLATYLNAGWLREQVCIHMCPYSRFQSVMFDQDTLIVSYDAARGESRGARNIKQDPKALGLGDCIDCTLCVQVCPTGIDIRNGLQIDCIGCGACVDVCNSVMDKMGYAKDLISYTSERKLSGGKTRLWRLSAVGYGAALTLMIGLFAWALAAREPVAITVSKDRGMGRSNLLGQVENDYRLKIINKTQYPRHYQVQLEADAALSMQPLPVLDLAPGEVLDLAVSVAMPKTADAPAIVPVEFVVRELHSDNVLVSAHSNFTAKRRY